MNEVVQNVQLKQEQQQQPPLLPSPPMNNGNYFNNTFHNNSNNHYQANGNGIGEFAGGDFINPQQTTLYVGNLDTNVTEENIFTLFSSFGPIKNLKLIKETAHNSDPFCFVDFVDHNNAAQALVSLNQKRIMNREIKVNWANGPPHGRNQRNQDHNSINNNQFGGGVHHENGYRSMGGDAGDQRQPFTIFVGDLCSDVDTAALKQAFSQFGDVSVCKVVVDPHTGKSKNYGFVSYDKQLDAEMAMSRMNGQRLGSRQIRTNWATRKPMGMNKSYDGSISNGQGGGHSGGGLHHGGQKLSPQEIFSQTSPTNTTVYVGGVMQGLTDEVITKLFTPFGPVADIRVFKDKGYAFIKYYSKEHATNAIWTMHNQPILNQIAKVSWGKDSGDLGGMQQAYALAASQQMAMAHQQAAMTQAALMYANGNPYGQPPPPHPMGPYGFYPLPQDPQAYMASAMQVNGNGGGGPPPGANPSQPMSSALPGGASSAAAALQFQYNQLYGMPPGQGVPPPGSDGPSPTAPGNSLPPNVVDPSQLSSQLQSQLNAQQQQLPAMANLCAPNGMPPNSLPQPQPHPQVPVGGTNQFNNPHQQVLGYQAQ